MNLSPSEKWLIELLIAAPQFTLPAADIITASRSADVGSPATIQRAGTTVAIKARRGGVSHWALRRAHYPVAEPLPPRPAPSAGQYDGWSFEMICNEAERRGLEIDRRSATEAEVELILTLDDHDGRSPEATKTARTHERVPLRW